MEDTLGRAPRRYLRTHGTHPLRPREVRSSRTTRCSRIARLREQPRSRPSREMLHQGPRTPTGKVQKRIVRASVVNLSENSRRPCPRACIGPCTPIARSLHAYRPRQTPARQQNAGRRRARTGLLRYIPRYIPATDRGMCGFGGQSLHSPCQKAPKYSSNLTNH